MTPFTILAAILGCLLLLLLISYCQPTQAVEQIYQSTMHTKRIRMVNAVEHNPFLDRWAIQMGSKSGKARLIYPSNCPAGGGQRAFEMPVGLNSKDIVYQQEQDPLLYVDDGTYYRQPIAIEGNRFWIEDHRPQINDLEWGQPLYSDRWACGLYNGSYKTYSS